MHFFSVSLLKSAILMCALKHRVMLVCVPKMDRKARVVSDHGCGLNQPGGRMKGVPGGEPPLYLGDTARAPPG